jgi:hypothetical protein
MLEKCHSARAEEHLSPFNMRHPIRCSLLLEKYHSARSEEHLSPFNMRHLIRCSLLLEECHSAHPEEYPSPFNIRHPIRYSLLLEKCHSTRPEEHLSPFNMTRKTHLSYINPPDVRWHSYFTQSNTKSQRLRLSIDSNTNFRNFQNHRRYFSNPTQ